MIGQWTVYFILMLDNINGFLVFLIMAPILTLLISGILAIFADDAGYGLDDNHFLVFFVKYWKKLTITSLSFMLINLFIPTTKQAALIYIIPKLSQSQYVKQIPQELQVVVNNLLKSKNSFILNDGGDKK